MTRHHGEALRAFFEGAGHLEPGPHGGLSPHRLPRRAAAQHDDLYFAMMDAYPAGVRLRFATSASSVLLEFASTSFEMDGFPPVPAGSIVARTADGGRLVSELPAGDVTSMGLDLTSLGTIERGPQRVQVSLPPRPSAEDAVELWLPHDRIIEIISLEAEAPLLPVADPRPRWTHYGSSISHGRDAPGPDLPWPNQVALAEGWNLRNLAFGGNAMLDPFAARVIRDQPAELITAKVGINLVNSDSMRRRAMLPALHGFIDTIREGHPETPLVLITAIACPVHEHTPGPTIRVAGQATASARQVERDAGCLTLSTTREVVRTVVAARQPADSHLHLVEGLDLFGLDEAHHLSDGLHPNLEGLSLIAGRFPALVRAAL